MHRGIIVHIIYHGMSMRLWIIGESTTLSKMIDPVRTLQLYMSLKMHFTTVTFDAIRGNGRVKHAGLAELERRNDKALIKAFSAKVDKTQEAAAILVANFAYGNDYPFADIDKAFTLHTKWQKVRQSLTKTFRDDIVFLNSYCEAHNREFKDLFEVNGIPLAYQLLLNGKIHIETLSIINRFENFVPLWMNSMKVWRKEFLRIQKVGSFIKIDETKYGIIYAEGVLKGTK